MSSPNSQDICSFLRHRFIFQPKIKCEDGGSYFYKNQKYRPLEQEKENFFQSYKRFSSKCSMFRQSISLITTAH